MRKILGAALMACALFLFSGVPAWATWAFGQGQPTTINWDGVDYQMFQSLTGVEWRWSWAGTHLSSAPATRSMDFTYYYLGIDGSSSPQILSGASKSGITFYFQYDSSGTYKNDGPYQSIGLEIGNGRPGRYRVRCQAPATNDDELIQRDFEYWYFPSPGYLAVRVQNQSGQYLSATIVPTNTWDDTYYQRVLTTTGSYVRLHALPSGTYQFRITYGGVSGLVSLAATSSDIDNPKKYTLTMTDTGYISPTSDSTPGPSPSPTPTPSPGIGTEEGANWFSSLFVPSTTTVEQWNSLLDSLKNYGPFGFVSAFLGAMQVQDTEFPPWDYAGINGRPGGVYVWQYPLNGEPINTEFDFRATTTPGPASPIYGTFGSVYGDIRAGVRWWMGLALYGAWVFGVYHWLKPRLSV